MCPTSVGYFFARSFWKAANGWQPRLESNQYLALRRGLFYPLNYGATAKAQPWASGLSRPKGRLSLGVRNSEIRRRKPGDIQPEGYLLVLAQDSVLVLQRGIEPPTY